MPVVTEWTFTANVANWINKILREHPELPFADTAAVEKNVPGSRKRHDLVLCDKNQKPFLTGEMKMPDKADGGSPYREAVVMDAHNKADAAGVEYFITWNVNRCVLWKTFEAGKPIAQRYVEDYSDVLAAPIKRSDDVESPRVQEQIQGFLLRLLERLAALISGVQPMLMLAPDEKFLNIWEAALQRPVAQTYEALNKKYEKDSVFTGQLDLWMREEQGWSISHKDEEVVRENLERAAKLSCYVLAGKIMFYKALRRKFTHLKELQIPDETTTGASLLILLEQYFASAMTATGDYETVFKSDYGNTLPFLEDQGVDGWRDLSLDTDGFDFTKIDYEIIGQIFERMLSVEERHKFGQHYTRSEVVDLINAFCIRDARARVMDPSCGGGTFLVRAYARLKQLSGGALTHDELIRQIFGIDISSFPAYLTTINLATRDLVDRANYPRVTNRDFFRTFPGDTLFHVPLGNNPQAMETLEKVDVIVGNPPYVRQEKINEYYGAAYKKELQELAKRESPTAELTGRSDLHCYFFPHSLSFLAEGGYIGLLVSSTWLDTGYGFSLQKFLLDNFEIVAIFESDCEPWFTGARVTTSAVILRHQPDKAKRQENYAKFVRLSVPLSQIVVSEREEGDIRPTFDQLRDRIEAMRGQEEFTISPVGGDIITVRQETAGGMRVRIIQQSDLEQIGCLPIAVDEELEDEDEEDDTSAYKEWHSEMGSSVLTEYTGYKWGIFLRAPDIFFKLLKLGASAFLPLVQIADVKFGTKSGCDKFFFVKDVTDQRIKESKTNNAFLDSYGISFQDTEDVRIVLDGDQKLQLLEAKYLKPIVRSMKEIDGINLNPVLQTSCILLVEDQPEDLVGTHVYNYIRQGENEHYNQRRTCASRSLWYNLLADRKPGLIFPKLQQYRHIVSLNPDGLYVNCSLLEIQTKGCSVEVLGAVLNSTVVAMIKHQFGRIHGREASLQMDVYATKMMLVPNPGHGNSKTTARLVEAMEQLRKRRAKPLIDVDGMEKGLSGELAMADRQELDDAVFELIGIKTSAERNALRAELYSEMIDLYRSMRVAEKLMQKYRGQSSRQGRACVYSIAEEIWKSFSLKPQFRTPLNYIGSQKGQVIELPVGKARILSANLLETAAVAIGTWAKDMKDVARAKFVKALSDEGVSGTVCVPDEPAICAAAVEKYEQHKQSVDEQLVSTAAQYTADEKMQERVVRELRRKMHQPVEY